MLGEELAGAFANEENAEGIDQAGQRIFLAGIDFVDQILRGFFGHAIESG